MFRSLILSLIFGAFLFLLSLILYNSILSTFDLNVVYTTPRESGMHGIFYAFGLFALGGFITFTASILKHKKAKYYYILLSGLLFIAVTMIKGWLLIPDTKAGLLASDIKFFITPYYTLALSALFFFIFKWSAGRKVKSHP